MPFCPKCRYEYVEGSGTCPDCNETLTDRLDDIDEITEIDNIKWKKLPSQPGRVFTEMYKEILDNNGIPCILQPGNISWMASAGTSSIGSKTYLLVPENRYEECIKLLDQTLNGM